MIRLRTHRPNGVPITLKYNRGGAYFIVPLADYNRKLYDIVEENLALSQQEINILKGEIIYAMAVIDNADPNILAGQETPYTELTPYEYNELYSVNHSSVWQLKSDPTIKVMVVEIPVMFEIKNNGDLMSEREVFDLFSKGYQEPLYKYIPSGEELNKLLEPSAS